jgi:hypothetical protein
LLEPPGCPRNEKLKLKRSQRLNVIEGVAVFVCYEAEDLGVFVLLDPGVNV